MMVDVFSNSYIFTIGKAPPIDGDACSVTENNIVIIYNS